MGFIKICGMTDGAAVEAALAAGVDAIGFVFAPSVRQVSPRAAAALAAPARGRVLCVAVTLHPQAADVERILAQFAPDVLQTDLADLAALHLPPDLVTWPVLRNGAAALAATQQRILFEGPRSGTGEVSDWSVARRLAARVELILAGGLAPGNVAEAIARVQPFGVDVSSGVEERPGVKSPAKIAEFVDRARAAFAGRLLETQE